MTKDEAMKLALEALKASHPISNTDKSLDKHSEAITALRQAIEREYNAVVSEREACARIVEQYTGAWDDQGYALAQAIRGRK